MEEMTSKVHRVLAHSYSFYLAAVFFGVILDMSFRIKVFNNNSFSVFGFVLIILASLLILWAQRTSRNLDTQNLTWEAFYKGPYRLSRSPTHWGLFFLLLGSGIVANAAFVIVLSIVSLFITKIYFLRKEEEILAQKYGEPYIQYKKKVRV
jgi:protein-S-isoprenylcysteine O-methyltransferase Ste14